MSRKAKKWIIISVISVMGIAGLTACGKGKSKNPVIEETQMGIQLEDKARDVVNQQGSDAQNADQMLDNMNGD